VPEALICPDGKVDMAVNHEMKVVGKVSLSGFYKISKFCSCHLAKGNTLSEINHHFLTSLGRQKEEIKIHSLLSSPFI
jgi:hypothetical protein